MCLRFLEEGIEEEGIEEIKKTNRTIGQMWKPMVFKEMKRKRTAGRERTEDRLIYKLHQFLGDWDQEFLEGCFWKKKINC